MTNQTNITDHSKAADRIGYAIWAEFIKSGKQGASVGSAGYSGCPDDGYLASYAGHERCYDADDFTDFHVRAYVADRVGKLSLSDYYGLWSRDGIVFCDVSRHFTDLDECLAFAESNGQIAIFDCTNKTDIDVRYV